MVVLVVLTIGTLWYVGARTKKDQKEKLDRYYQEIMAKEKNLESVIKEADKSSAVSTDLNLPISGDWQTVKINLKQATSTETLKQYGLDLGRALNVFSTKRESEVTATYQALDKKDPTELKKVVSSRLIHETAVEKLTLVAVPQGLANYHRQLINSLNNSVNFLSQMEQVLNNPESAMEASRLFVQESILFHQIINKLSNYLSARQIQFSADEKIKILFEL